MNLEQLKNPKYNIIHITKPRCLALLRMVKPPSPIHRNIRLLPVQLGRRAHRTAGGGLAELEQAVEHGTVLADVEALEVAGVDVVADGGGAYGGEEVDVVVGVEAADVVGGGHVGLVDLHEAVEGVVDDEVVRHSDAVGFHRVALAVVVVSDRRLVEVAHPALFSVRSDRGERCASHYLLHHCALSL